MKKNMKFVFGTLIIVSAIIYLGITGFRQDVSYYITVDELDEMGTEAYDLKLRVAGQVVIGSIDQKSDPIKFAISQNDATLDVVYVGEAPIPDTFKDHAQTVVQGIYKQNGVFEADHIQAKCASKYESMVEEASIK
jgi:cytochrome c-type biogenesis protein CcmE